MHENGHLTACGRKATGIRVLAEGRLYPWCDLHQPGAPYPEQDEERKSNSITTMLVASLTLGLLCAVLLGLWFGVIGGK